MTCDSLVTYPDLVNGDTDQVFKALADPTRRSLLDKLFREDGQTLHQLEARFTMTRFGVMKHLKVLGRRPRRHATHRAGRSCTTSIPSRSAWSTTGG